MMEPELGDQVNTGDQVNDFESPFPRCPGLSREANAVTRRCLTKWQVSLNTAFFAAEVHLSLCAACPPPAGTAFLSSPLIGTWHLRHLWELVPAFQGIPSVFFIPLSLLTCKSSEERHLELQCPE